MPLSEVPDVLRALGFYPSEYELANLVNEVKYSDFAATQKIADSVDLLTLLKLFTNHRPALGVSPAAIQAAFTALSDDGSGRVDTAALLQLLQEQGEALSEAELASILGELVGSSDAGDALPPSLDAAAFMAHVLGLGAPSAAATRPASAY
jgi:Ca2+-binding EF-hand superfamily protein